MYSDFPIALATLLRASLDQYPTDGLWTEYSDGTWPACCSGRPFDEREISTLLEPLRKYWPSLSCGSPRSCHRKRGPFWAHEVVSLLSLFIDCLNLTQFKELTHSPCIPLC
ncbi:hypothetical protein HAX54_019566 [Datura stramonium]|uniref:Uncharacterized protein n=1 Tax=Datura stramonium TaxID=4076 RepID=A0ABS8UPJ3_DATST|nr:hypothetical protein [Datura stramonium]